MIEGRSGNLYHPVSNQGLLHAWEREEPSARARWFTQVRAALAELGAPPAIMARLGPAEALAVAVVHDGCPEYTLTRSQRTFLLLLRGWWVADVR
jgi:hypothetical protein